MYARQGGHDAWVWTQPSPRHRVVEHGLHGFKRQKLVPFVYISLQNYLMVSVAKSGAGTPYRGVFQSLSKDQG